jgi:pimeloyl-ACP methyl ester carboxylesterase
VSDAGPFAYDRYETGGAREWLLRIGGADGTPILLLPPLLEEMNRTRALLLDVMRRLAASGHGCWLPDLPGTGESERALEGCSWEEWHAAARDAASHIAQATGRRAGIASFRGGTLLDDAAEAAWVWRLAPAAGSSLVRDLERSSLVASRDQEPGQMVLAGYKLGAALLDGLRAAEPMPVPRLRTVRLASDPGEADRKLEGSALWRRSEPANSPELAAAAAFDIEDWIARCGSC